MTTKTRIVAAAAALAAFSGAASADIVTMKYVGAGSGQNIKFRLNGGSEQHVFAGQLRHNISSGTGIAEDWTGEHILYCTDIYEYVATSYKPFTITGLESAPNSKPMGTQTAQALYDVFNAFSDVALMIGAGNEFAAAFQVAIWEIVTDFNPDVGVSSLNLDSGGFKLTQVNGSSSRSTSFTSAISSIFGAIGTESHSNLLALSASGSQDQLFYVPAPGPLALAGAGALMLARRRRA